jgi:hypothetical protein
MLPALPACHVACLCCAAWGRRVAAWPAGCSGSGPLQWGAPCMLARWKLAGAGLVGTAAMGTCKMVHRPSPVGCLHLSVVS